ncbi:hypothetical protein GJAV_G00257180 [Gymnothorax javanicus]|nr:hypothetical protein GJAV_G00257180 [Gymnothorax javanicus]
MAGRRGCMNSLWSGSERVRFGERLKASLAGILELDLLRFRHLEMVEGALGRRDGIEQKLGSSEWISADGTARSRRQQGSEPGLPSCSGFRDGLDSRWSTLSWDISSDPLSPPTPDLSVAAQLDCDSRPSSGFYSVSGSSLSDSCCSVCSEGAQGALGGAGGVRSSWGPLECRPQSADHSAPQWRECRLQPNQNATGDTGERPVSTGDLEVSGLLLFSELCTGVAQSQMGSFYPNAANQSRLQLDPKFCSDLVSRKTKEVYPYPSPLHAVALQSPLFTSPQDPVPPNLNLPPTSEASRLDEPKEEASVYTGQLAPPNLSQLDQYISKLVLQYHSRSTTDLSSRPGSRKWSSGPARGSSQSLTSFDSHSASSTMTVTQRRSFLGHTGSIGTGRKRISTCLQTVSHRGSMEVKGTGFSPQDFSRSMDWSGIPPEPEENPAKAYEGSPKISEDSARVCEIARVSGLPRSVVAGLLEEGVELDEDCFRSEAERGERAEAFLEGALASSPSPYSHFQLPESDQPGSYPNTAALSHSTGYPHPELDVHLPTHCPPSFTDGLSTPSAHGQTTQAARQSTPVTHFDCHPSALAHPSPLPLSRLQTPSPPSSPSNSQSSKHSIHPTAHSPSPSQSHATFTPASLSVFHRDSPSQTSLPRLRVHRSPFEGEWRPRGGSLRQESGVGWESRGRGWRRAEGERLYQGKHASRELVRASTVSSFAGRESCSRWEEEETEGDLGSTVKRGTSFRKRLEGLFGGKEKERGVGGKKEGGKPKSSSDKPFNNVKMGKTVEEGEQENSSNHKGMARSSRNSGLRPVGGLFRSESQGVLDRRFHKQSSKERRQPWVSSLEIARAGLEYNSQGLSLERARAFGGGEDERLSSTASLFHLSRSQSPEGSCLSLSPLSSPSLSPPAAPARMTRSRSFRDLGRRVFGSVKPFGFKSQSLRK